MCCRALGFVVVFVVLGVSFNSVYTQIWRVLLHLAADPYPDVSDLAMKVLNSIAYKVRPGPAQLCLPAVGCGFSHAQARLRQSDLDGSVGGLCLLQKELLMLHSAKLCSEL